MNRKYELLKSQKNEVFKVLHDRMFEPSSFSWDYIDLMPSLDLVVPRLNYQDGTYFFEFRGYDSGKFGALFSPGKEKIKEYHEANSWVAVIMYLRKWLNYLTEEVEAYDLWSEIDKYKIIFSQNLSHDTVNEPISACDAEEIGRRLILLANKIEQRFTLDESQGKFVRSKLTYLAEAAKRQYITDWVHTMIGVVVTIAIGLTLAPEKARELWELIKSALGDIVHLLN